MPLNKRRIAGQRGDIVTGAKARSASKRSTGSPLLPAAIAAAIIERAWSIRPASMACFTSGKLTSGAAPAALATISRASISLSIGRWI